MTATIRQILAIASLVDALGLPEEAQRLTERALDAHERALRLLDIQPQLELLPFQH